MKLKSKNNYLKKMINIIKIKNKKYEINIHKMEIIKRKIGRKICKY